MADYIKQIEVSGSIILHDRLKSGDNRQVPLQGMMIQVAKGPGTPHPEGTVIVNILAEGCALAVLLMPRDSLAEFEKCLLSALMEGAS